MGWLSGVGHVALGNGLPPAGDQRPQLRTRLLEGHAGREPAHEVQVVGGAVRGVGPDLHRHPHVHPRILDVKPFRHHAGDGGRRPVNLNPSAGELRVALEIGVFAPGGSGDGPGAPLYLERHRVGSGKRTITVTVPREPARAGIDPYGKLIQRNAGDNLVDVGVVTTARPGR